MLRGRRPAGLAPRHKSQNYKTNSSNSFELSWLRFEEQAKTGQEEGFLGVDFAKRIGVIRSHLSAVEHGRHEVGEEVLHI